MVSPGLLGAQGERVVGVQDCSAPVGLREPRVGKKTRLAG